MDFRRQQVLIEVSKKGTMHMRNCGNCNYCAENGEDLVCVNDKSEYVADFVSENHSCDEWDGTDDEDDLK